MNQLFKILIVSILFICCKKQQVNPKKDSSSNPIIEKKGKQITEKRTIQEFLKELRKNINNKNVKEIAKKIKIPFEFYVAGELDYSVTNVSDLIHESSDFIKIVDSKFLEENNGIYYILYDKEITKADPEGGFVIYFKIKRDGNNFKVISMEKPN